MGARRQGKGLFSGTNYFCSPGPQSRLLRHTNYLTPDRHPSPPRRADDENCSYLMPCYFFIQSSYVCDMLACLKIDRW